jgi:hypothetical protein
LSFCNAGELGDFATPSSSSPVSKIFKKKMANKLVFSKKIEEEPNSSSWISWEVISFC